MSVIKQTAEAIIHRVLCARDVPEERWPALVKKTGRGMILLGVLMVVPLLIIDSVPLPVTVLLQVFYAALVCTGAILSLENTKSSDKQLNR